MRIPIFNLDNNTNYKKEYLKMIKILNSKCITFDKKDYTYFDYINNHIFHNWKYRKTYLDCFEYLDSIGINIKNKKVNKDSFLNLLEFILNMQLIIDNIKYYQDKTKISIKGKSIINHNIPIILDELGYQAYRLEDRIIILEKDINYEDIESLLPNDILELLYSYKNINNNSIKMKRLILNKIYNYLEDNIDKYKTLNNQIYNTIKLIVTKMGISKEIDKKYQDLSNYKLKKYYDYCFQMICYLVKTENINKYKEEIKKEG